LVRTQRRAGAQD